MAYGVLPLHDGADPGRTPDWAWRVVPGAQAGGEQARGKSRDSSVLRLPVGCGSAIIYASGRAATNRPLPNGRTTWGGPNANDMRTSDPYYEWLGIPPKDQPPNHYRLLGLELFEENRNVIDAAANRQMSFIKEYQAGPDSELSQKLLNELSAARLCLLSPPAKAAYDQQLRTRLKAQAAPAPALPIPPALRWRNEPAPPPPHTHTRPSMEVFRQVRWRTQSRTP